MSLIKFFFGVAYILQIFSTVVLVRESEALSSAVMTLRLFSFGMIALFWVIVFGYKNRWGAYVLIIVLALTPYFFTDAIMAVIDVAFVLMLAIYFGARLTEGDRFYSSLAYISLFAVILILVLYYLGVIPTQVFEWDGRVKNSLGFSNPNTLFFYIFSAAFVFYGQRVRLGFYLAGIMMALLYGTVGSRTFMFAYLVLLGFWLWPRLYEVVVMKAALSIALVGLICIGLVATWFPVELAGVADKMLMIDINELVSNRFAVLERSGGARSIWQVLFGGQENFADSLYYYFYSGFGLVGILIGLWFVFWGIRSSSRSRQTSLLAMCIIYFMVGLVELPFDATSLMAAYLAYLFFRARPTQSAYVLP